MYSLILLDIDGTLIKDDLTISESTVESLNRAREMGLGIVLCTGRYIQGAKFYLEEMKIDDGIIASMNGALIKNGKEYLNDQRIDKNAYTATASILYKRVPSIIAFGEDNYAIDSNDEYYEKQCVICRQKGIRMDIRNYDRTERAIDEPIYKILVKTDSKRDADTLKEEVRRAINQSAEILSSSSVNFEILSKGVDKENIIFTLEEKLQIPHSNMIAFGDWDNDALMLKSAGLGIAMGNASLKCKENADYITTDNNHDGIYNALNRFLFS